jgi:hypothetical protein
VYPGYEMGGRRKPTVSHGKRRVTGTDRSCESETYLFLNFSNFFGFCREKESHQYAITYCATLISPKKSYFYKLS